MTYPLLAAVLVQSAVWSVSPSGATVGDTIWVERTVVATAGARARLRPMESTSVYEPLDAPVAVDSAGRIWIRYTVAVFEPGTHMLPMPAVELVFPDGTGRTVAGDTARVALASVLPEGDTRLEPKPSLGPIGRPLRRPLLPVIFGGIAVGGVLGWVVLRRRARSMPAPSSSVPEEIGPPLMRWIAAGEVRAVASVATERLRERISRLAPSAQARLGVDACLSALASERPDLPVGEIGEALRALERARFAPAVSEIVVLADHVETLLESFDVRELEIG